MVLRVSSLFGRVRGKENSLDKALTVYIAFSQHASLADATNLIWTSSDMEIFSGTVTFWFIDRALATRRTS
ncbi:hypothetical protein [Paraburkholderia tuberum]|uniref:hypothetical protein n=1 Tax=Paraburkholderia TaxID=1822464 RepID=UPI00036F7515|nr:hypothetical protein [Paraburkholderia tuberum]